MKTLIDLIAFVLGHFLKLSPPFATRNSQLHGMTAPPPALLFFAHFCVTVGFIDTFGSPVIVVKRKCNN